MTPAYSTWRRVETQHCRCVMTFTMKKQAGAVQTLVKVRVRAQCHGLVQHNVTSSPDETRVGVRGFDLISQQVEHDCI